MGQKYLIDTNPVIDFFNRRLPVKGEVFMKTIEPEISVITQIELLSNKNIPLEEWEQIQGFISVASVYALENNIVQQTILLRQKYKIKTPDAIIAATALVYNLILISRNITDFKDISRLKLVDPYNLQ
ncbi:MAG: type II toxin-antitoxin system VapC family toxin [Mucilaginibacter sp.]|uniref:type II toxin-antitoxin system VapC family toxin n=1 Tax=Mucilaginibacter sp. TaxID=1882438 RepID=UPI0034E5B10D